MALIDDGDLGEKKNATYHIFVICRQNQLTFFGNQEKGSNLI